MISAASVTRSLPARASAAAGRQMRARMHQQFHLTVIAPTALQLTKP
ncbi:MAG: hypothetical protein J0H18_17810 [Rhizobiales bacterium]|nr:hypothetical protein [Hyphomicrobiales bacterium]